MQVLGACIPAGAVSSGLDALSKANLPFQATALPPGCHSRTSLQSSQQPAWVRACAHVNDPRISQKKTSIQDQHCSLFRHRKGLGPQAKASDSLDGYQSCWFGLGNAEQKRMWSSKARIAMGAANCIAVSGSETVKMYQCAETLLAETAAVRALEDPT